MHSCAYPFFYFLYEFLQLTPSPLPPRPRIEHLNSQAHRNSIYMYEKKIHKTLCSMGNTHLSLYLKMDFKPI